MKPPPLAQEPVPEHPAALPPLETGARYAAPRRTEPLGLIVRAIASLRQAILPAAALLFAARGEAWTPGLIFLGLILLLGFNFGFAALSWARRTYRVGEEDIRVESGIFSRAARSVPYERIQDVSLKQALLPRLFGLVEVAFETGAGAGEDLKLAYLSEEQGEELRELVRARRAEEEARRASAPDRAASGSAPAECAALPEPQVLFRMNPKRLIQFGLFEFSLVAVAVLFGLTQQFDFLLPFEIWDFKAWEAQLAGPGAWLSGLGMAAQVIGGLLVGLSLILLGFATGIIRTLLRDWGFVLEKTARGFRRRRGLLTRTDVVMPLHRVQAVTISTGMLRYRFGWHCLSFISLAQDAGKANHLVAPFARLDEIAPIVEAAGFNLPSPTSDWHRASPLYRNDRIALESGLLGLLALALGLAAPTLFALPLALAALGLAGLAALGNLYGWRFRRHARDARQIYYSRGFLSPKQSIASQAKLHSVEIRQGPIAQFRGYCDLRLGLAGGTFSLRGVPENTARELRRALIEAMASKDFSALGESPGGEPACQSPQAS